MTWHDAIHDIRDKYPMAAAIGRALRDEGYVSPSCCKSLADYYDDRSIGAILIWKLPDWRHVVIWCDLGHPSYDCFRCAYAGRPMDSVVGDLSEALQFARGLLPKVV